MTNSSNPLVSVGVPTYNRAEGLRRTLALICAQTYRNIEILVSDNASPNDDTSNVVLEFQSRENRIQYFRQASNFGAAENFRFVLRKAQGEFFMWAADDDEWDPRFIEACLTNIGDAGSAMTLHRTVFRASRQVTEERVPELKTTNGPYTNGRAYLEVVDSVLFYGLHRRSTIQPILNEEMVDFYDCFFVFRQVIEHGLVIVPEWLFSSGVDATEYEYKPANPLQKRRFQYLPFLTAGLKAILDSKRLEPIEKGQLLNRLMQKTLELYCWHEKTFQPRRVRLAGSVERALRHFEGLVTRYFGI